jgi:hypothetical protein
MCAARWKIVGAHQTHDGWGQNVRLWASAEVFNTVFPAMDRLRKTLEPKINQALEASTLAKLPGELRYIPIAMPKEKQMRYPARNQVRKDEGVCVCAPQLDYNAFVQGSFEVQVAEYLNGVATCLPDLPSFGASAAQVKEFKAILERVSAQVLSRSPQLADSA